MVAEVLAVLDKLRHPGKEAGIQLTRMWTAMGGTIHGTWIPASLPE